MSAIQNSNHREVSSSEALATTVVQGALDASSGALAARIFITSVSPMGGALFGVVHGVSSGIAVKVLDKMFGNSTSEKILKFVLRVLIPITIAISAASLVGYALTFETAAYLCLAMIPTAVITAIGFECLKYLADA